VVSATLAVALFYCSGDQIKEDELTGHVEILIGKPEGKRPLGRPRLRWEDNIRMELREIGWEGVDWLHLHQDRDQWWAVKNFVMNLRVP
jgi:hypothetical protein